MDKLAAEAAPRGAICGVRKYLESVSEADADELRAALASIYPSTMLARVLKRQGVDVTAYTLQRHRKGDCLCSSKTS